MIRRSAFRAPSSFSSSALHSPFPSSPSCHCLLLASSSACFFAAQRSQVWCTIPPTRTWMCAAPSCLTTNVQNTRACTKCGDAKPSLLYSAGWVCEQCECKNPSSVSFCRECAAQFVWPKLWRCPSCKKDNPVLAQNAGVTPPECNFCTYTVRPGADAEQQQQDPARRSAGGSAVVDASRSLPPSARIPVFTSPEKKSNIVSKSTQSTMLQKDDEAAAAAAAAGEFGDEGPPEITLKSMEEQQQEQIAKQRANEQRDREEAKDIGPPGFPWMCRSKECGAENNGATVACTKCSQKIFPSDWLCNRCGVSNFKLRSGCFNCSAPIQPYWFCRSCSTRTSSYERSCRKCGSAQPEPAATSSSSSSPSFSSHHFGGGGSRSGGGDWVCAVCQKFNYARRTVCIGCETARGLSPCDEGANALPTVSEITPVGDSNWRCHICPALNFRSRTSCWQCQTPRLMDSGAFDSMPQQMEDESTSPEIKKEGFQEDPKKPVSFGIAGMSDAEIAEETARLKMERRKKVIQWSDANSFAPGAPAIGSASSSSSASASYAAAAGIMDDGMDWVCVKCMRKNVGGAAECARCMAPKSVALGSRALAALSANRVKRISKI